MNPSISVAQLNIAPSIRPSAWAEAPPLGPDANALSFAERSVRRLRDIGNGLPA